MDQYVDIIEVIKNTYCFYRQNYVMMKKNYTKTVGHYFKDNVIESHLNGNYALCVFSGPKITKFLCIDIDEGGKAAVKKVVKALIELGIPKDRIYISISGKKGYHVDIFFNPYIYNEKAKNLYDLVIWKTGLNPRKVEYMPRPTHAVKIPLGVHAKTGKRCWFLDCNTLKPIERMDYIKEIVPVDSEVLFSILKEWNKKRWNELYVEMVCEQTGHDETIVKDMNFDDDYWESRRIVDCGTRHDTMVKIACDFRHYGANMFQIEKALRGFYYRQDPLMMETSEDEVMDDIKEIAKWAEESVPVWKYRPSPNEGKTKSIIFDKYDINYILKAPTSAARRVALLLWTYCKIFGASHISYSAIASTVGCSVATVETAINKLVELKIISRQSGGCHYKNGRLIRKSNTYFMPNEKTYGCPDSADLFADKYEITEKITRENFVSNYYRVLAGICKPEYLAKYLTKPELEECRRVQEDEKE